MTDPTPTDAEREAQFRQWIDAEERRREVARLRRELSRLDWIQFASYILSLVWVFGTAVTYQRRPDLVPADVAGLITLSVFLGGGLLIWYIIRLKRELRRRLDSLVPDPPAE